MPRTPRCQHEPCRGPLPITARTDARYCSGRCRTAACRARRSIPRELTSRPRWVRRSARKVPLTTGGATASSTDPGTWARYREAAASDAGAGLGYVLADGDGVVCLDLDHCLTADGEVVGWAQNILDAARPTWVERSVSGDGLHVWGLGELQHGRRIALDGGGTVELYGTGRYIAVTGQTFGGTPQRLGDLGPLIRELL
ncbi:DNA primase [Streptomyces sp. NPDC053499]|uniref:DNA primase n=1 Tax=Streptomyces sp. NPDC053499 TaxID=3365707 RepID=UPI0037CED366